MIGVRYVIKFAMSKISNSEILMEVDTSKEINGQIKKQEQGQTIYIYDSVPMHVKTKGWLWMCISNTLHFMC